MRVSIDRFRKIIKEETKRALRSRGLSEATRQPHNLESDLRGLEPDDEGVMELELTVIDRDGGEHRAVVTKEVSYSFAIDGEKVAAGPSEYVVTDYMLNNRMEFYY